MKTYRVIVGLFSLIVGIPLIGILSEYFFDNKTFDQAAMVIMPILKGELIFVLVVAIVIGVIWGFKINL